MAGKSGHFTANSEMAMRPSQKYGMAEMNVVTGSRLSIQEPRRQPVKTPIPVPSTKLISVVMPTSASVHGSDWAMTSLTGVGKKVKDRPRSPSSRWPQ